MSEGFNPVNPTPFLAELTGSAVIVKLKWGMEYKGTLISVDQYFNVRLANAEVPWNDRAHFFAVAATTMRRILVDEARRRAADKRGGGEVRRFADLSKSWLGESMFEGGGATPSQFAMAREHSQCPSGAQGGDLGTFGPGQMVPEFDTVVFSGDVGVVHGPVQTQFGYHLIEITERTD